MQRWILRSAAAIAAAALVGATTGGAVQAAPGDFGQHVRHCTQTMGFDGEHNPGMHRGAAGWDPTHTC